jgi:hypothetical protein
VKGEGGGERGKRKAYEDRIIRNVFCNVVQPQCVDAHDGCNDG